MSKRHGDKRSAAGGKQGHQRTPAFIHAILKQSLDNNTSSDEMQPLGGLTDVGLHTGGEKRDTCYSLVRSVFQWFLDQASFCCYEEITPMEKSFDVLLVHFEMYLLNTAFSATTGLDTTKLRLDDQTNHLFIVMKNVTINAARLADRGYNCTTIYQELKGYQETIESMFKKWDTFNLEKYSLKEFEDFTSLKSPCFTGFFFK